MPDDLPREPASVRETYERIAPHFDATRSHVWPAVERFVEAYADGGRGLDLGCGNGRHLEGVRQRVDHAIGVDLSRAMLRRAASRLDGVDLVEASALGIPLAADTVAVALYVATVHHLPDRRRRVASLNELARVLAPDGVGLVSAWAVTHDRFDAEAATERAVDWTCPDGTTVPRYYFLYDRPTFDAELAASDLAVDHRWEEAGNLYARVGPADG